MGRETIREKRGRSGEDVKRVRKQVCGIRKLTYKSRISLLVNDILVDGKFVVGGGGI